MTGSHTSHGSHRSHGAGGGTGGGPEGSSGGDGPASRDAGGGAATAIAEPPSVGGDGDGWDAPGDAQDASGDAPDAPGDALDASGDVQDTSGDDQGAFGDGMRDTPGGIRRDGSGDTPKGRGRGKNFRNLRDRLRDPRGLVGPILPRIRRGARGGASRAAAAVRGAVVTGGTAVWRGARAFAADPRGHLRDRRARTWALMRRHPAFTVVMALAALLRVIAMIGYQPAMFFNDSFDYLHVAMEPYPHPLRPDGYAFLLLILRPFHSFALVSLLQHLMALGMGVMVYALLRRRFGLPGWGAALACVPFLLDGYQIQLEHLILSDTMFTFLVIAAVTLLLWNDRPTWKIAASLGLIVGLAWLTRSVGLPVLVGVLTYMLIRRHGLKIMATTLAFCLLPVLAYMTWYKIENDKFAMTESNGIFLYARVYKFADCHRFDAPTEEIPLCTEPKNRLPNSQDGIWNALSPLGRYPGERFSPENNDLAGSYAQRAILAQPGDYAKVVGYDFLRVFRWDRKVFPDKATYQQYEFGKTSSALPNWRMDNDVTAADEAVAYEKGRARTSVVEPFASTIRIYQDHVYMRGTMVGIVLLMGLAGMAAMWRRLGGMAFLPWTLATGLLLAPAATAEFDYRYVLPSVPLACLALGMAFSPEGRGRMAELLRLRRRTAEGVPAELEPAPEPVEEKVPEPAAN